MRTRLAVPLALLALLVLPAAASATASYWPVSASPSNHFGWGSWGSKTAMDVVADGGDGYFVAWDDGSSGHVQHVLANGSFAWPWYVYQPEGSTGGYMNPAIALDGAGGVLLAYESHGSGDELRLQRVSAAGAPAPGWPAAGVAVCPSADYDYYADVAADGSGGAFVSFVRSGPYQVYVQHVLATGVLDPYWPADGVQLQKNGMTFLPPHVFSDGEGGAMVFYSGGPAGNGSVFATRVDRYGNKRWDLFPDDGLVLSSTVSSGGGENIAAVRTLDGLFGVAWIDGRSGTTEVHIDVLDANGRTGAAPEGGLALTSAPGVSKHWPALATNPSRDFLLTWVQGSSIMGARRQQDLSLHPAFPVGIAPAGQGSYVHDPAIASDGGEGMLIAWHDPADYAVLRVQHLTGAGVPALGWAASGESLATNPDGLGDYVRVVADGDGGAIGVFTDHYLLGTNRVRRDGSHGRYAPAVFQALADVNNDQGGRLALYWRASEIDTTPANPVGSYMVWRKMPAVFAQSRLADGARLLGAHDSPAAGGPGAIRAVSAAPSVTEYWEYLGSTPARGWAGYGMTVSTYSDYLGPSWGFPWETYLLETVSTAGAVLGTSAPDSGFSMDNLAPALPAAFTAVRSGGATRLHWARNGEPDLRDYRLHRGTSASFVPSDANLVSVQADTGFVDTAAPGAFYQLAAADVHGNLSPYALVTPAQTLDAPASATAALAFAPIAPNPARGRVSLSFALPAPVRVALAVYDAQGRLARTVVDGTLAAGRHDVAWDLRADDGRALAPGLYLARLATPAGTRVRRLVIVE